MLLVDQLLLDRFFNNQCNEQENQAVLAWLAQPENQENARAWMQKQWLDAQIDSPQNAESQIDFSQLLSNIHERIATNVPSSGDASSIPYNAPKLPFIQTPEKELSLYKDAIKSEKKKSRFSISHRLSRFSSRIAASLVVFVLASAIYYSVKNPYKLTLALSNLEEKSNAIGQRSVLRLADGTQVWLNVGSTLKYPLSFVGKKNREVYLEGEAYFDVVENKQCPFIVHTDGIKIKVLGTAFNVKSYVSDKTIETTLIRGKVAIENTNSDSEEQVVLAPNQRAVFSRKTERISLAATTPDIYISWKSGSLIFEDETLENVINTLERWYGVKIHLEDSTNKDCRLTAKIDQESLVQMLELLKSTTQISYFIQDKEVYIRGTVCD